LLGGVTAVSKNAKNNPSNQSLANLGEIDPPMAVAEGQKVSRACVDYVAFYIAATLYMC
jgi:hypothetical protein